MRKMFHIYCVLVLLALLSEPLMGDFSESENFNTNLNGWSDDAGIMTWGTDPAFGGVCQLTSPTANQLTRILLPDIYDGDWGSFGTGQQYIQWYTKNMPSYSMSYQRMYFVSYSAGAASYSQWNYYTGSKWNTDWFATNVPFNADWTDAQAEAVGWINGAAASGGAGWAATVANVDNAHILSRGGSTGYDAMFDAFTPGGILVCDPDVPSGLNPRGDIDHDCDVDLADLMILIGNWLAGT